MSNAAWLPEDLTGTASTNLITAEEHPINSVSSGNNKIIITPNYGAFYDNDSLVVTLTQNNHESTLVRDSDYRVIGIDYGRTKASSATAGVYHFILLTNSGSNPISANSVITITYQAFGGYMTNAAYTNIMNSIADYGSRITTLEQDTASIPTSTDISALEADVRKLQDKYNYHPSENYSIELSSLNTKWYTIAVSSADLDNYIDFNNKSTLAGVGSFSIHSPKLEMTFDLAYNLDECTLKINVTNQMLYSLNLVDEVQNDSYFGNNNLIIPKFRIVTNRGSGHKLYLQMALMTNGSIGEESSYELYIDNDCKRVAMPTTVQVNNVNEVVTDYHVGWELYSTPITQNVDYDADAIEQVSQNYKRSSDVLGLQRYYKIWEGNINLSMIQDVSWEPSTTILKRTEYGLVLIPFGVLTLSGNSVSSFKVDIYDRLEKKMLTFEMLASTVLNSSSSVYAATGDVNYFPMDNGILGIVLNPGLTPSIFVYNFSGRNSYINKRFDLRGIYIK